jgi:hypothetical protein
MHSPADPELYQPWLPCACSDLPPMPAARELGEYLSRSCARPSSCSTRDACAATLLGAKDPALPWIPVLACMFAFFGRYGHASQAVERGRGHGRRTGWHGCGWNRALRFPTPRREGAGLESRDRESERGVRVWRIWEWCEKTARNEPRLAYYIRIRIQLYWGLCVRSHAMRRGGGCRRVGPGLFLKP